MVLVFGRLPELYVKFSVKEQTRELGMDSGNQCLEDWWKILLLAFGGQKIMMNCPRGSRFNCQCIIVQGSGKGFKHPFDACKVFNLATFSAVAKFLLNTTVTCLTIKIESW